MLLKTLIRCRSIFPNGGSTNQAQQYLTFEEFPSICAKSQGTISLVRVCEEGDNTCDVSYYVVVARHAIYICNKKPKNTIIAPPHCYYWLADD